MIQLGERIYPRARIACVIVWLLDRLPARIRVQVLESFWTEADVELAKMRARELSALFNTEDEGSKDDGHS